MNLWQQIAGAQPRAHSIAEAKRLVAIRDRMLHTAALTHHDRGPRVVVTLRSGNPLVRSAASGIIRAGQRIR